MASSFPRWQASLLIAGAAVVAFGGAVILAIVHPPPLAPLSVADLAFGLPYLAFALVGAFVVWRRPAHRLGWVMSAIGVSMCLGLALVEVGRWRDRLLDLDGLIGAGIYQTGQTFTSLAFTLILVLLLLFPTGRLAGRFARVVLWLILLIGSLEVLTNLLDNPVLYDEGIPNPFHLALPILPLTALRGPGSFWIFGLALLTVTLSLLRRFRRADPDTRLQLKWFVFSVVGAAAFTFVDGVVQAASPASLALDSLATILYSFAWMAAIVGIGIAVLKYQLWAIDLVISRTLTYGTLVGVVALVYVAVVAGVGTFLGAASGLSWGIAAMAIVAVAIQPARSRLQEIANRIVYGERASPYELLADFTDRVARTLAADEVATRMAGALAEGTLADRAALWLSHGGKLALAATWPPGLAPGKPDSATRAVEVRHEGQPLGLLAVWRRPGEELGAIEQKLMDDLARQAGLVLRGVALDEELRHSLNELRASRRRLVEAQDRERRRLERDLHDGAQQHLVALSVSLGLEAQAAGDPEQAVRLETLRRDAIAALDTLRELARGLAPPLLESEGLGSALAALARRAPLPVDVCANERCAWREVEAAVYFCCAEALQNVTKHAGASRAQVRVTRNGNRLQFEVSDDGRGFNPDSIGDGTGLQNMRDRLEALGGEFEVRTGEGGSVVAGSVPC